MNNSGKMEISLTIAIILHKISEAQIEYDCEQKNGSNKLCYMTGRVWR